MVILSSTTHRTKYSPILKVIPKMFLHFSRKTKMLLKYFFGEIGLYRFYFLITIHELLWTVNYRNYPLKQYIDYYCVNRNTQSGDNSLLLLELSCGWNRNSFVVTMGNYGKWTLFKYYHIPKYTLKHITQNLYKFFLWSTSLQLLQQNFKFSHRENATNERQNEEDTWETVQA